MKKKLLFLIGIMITFIIMVAIVIKVMTPKEDMLFSDKEDKLRVVTTIYPLYMVGLNIAEHTEGIQMNNLTDMNTGCLHDYQLTTRDMRLISEADILIINGGGMESFLEDITANYPMLTIIDSSIGIELLSEDSDHEEANAHFWLDPKRYIKQIENVRDGLLQYLEEGKKASLLGTAQSIEKNAENYMNKVVEIDMEIDEIGRSFADMQSQTSVDMEAVIFHDAFAYLASRIGIKVAFHVELDNDTALSAGEIAEIIDEVDLGKIQYLFTEQQYSDSIAKQIEAETEAKMYIIDSAVTGDGAEDSYIEAMYKNIDVIREALQITG